MRQFVTFGLLGLLFCCYLVLRQTSQEIRKVKSLNRKKPVYTLASVYTGPSTISLAIATVLFCFLYMYRTLADPKLLCGAADGGLVFHDVLPELGGAVVDNIV